MNATATIKEEVRTDSLVREIALDKIQESKTNPRTHFDEGALAELAANIKEHGVLQPVLLRPRPNGASDRYELVVGSRRYRASKLVRRETIPATIRDLTDTQVVEIQLVENLLREGVHELDEASGYGSSTAATPLSCGTHYLHRPQGRCGFLSRLNYWRYYSRAQIRL